MTNSLFAGQEQVRVRALYLGQRLDLKAFRDAQRLADVPLVITAGVAGCAVLFRYGVAVVCGLNALEEVTFANDIKQFVNDPMERVEHDELTIVLAAPGNGEQVVPGGIRLQDFSLQRVQLVADALAKSVVLAYYESNVAEIFDRIEPLAADLQRFGRGGRKAKELLRHIGHTLSIQSRMVGRVEVEEKPELLWERPELERLFMRLQDEYELRERHLALERKLELISRTAETLLSLLQNKRTLYVEWYIVFLILFEIMLSLWDKFGGTP